MSTAQQIALQRLRDASSSTARAEPSTTPRPAPLESALHEHLVGFIKAMDADILRDALLELVKKDSNFEAMLYKELVTPEKGPIWQRCPRCGEEFDSSVPLVKGACKHHSRKSTFCGDEDDEDDVDSEGEPFDSEERPDLWECADCDGTLDTPPCGKSFHTLTTRKRKRL